MEFREKLAGALDNLPMDSLDGVSAVIQAAGSVSAAPDQVSCS